jgi:outer membrane immunogenic protein
MKRILLAGLGLLALAAQPALAADRPLPYKAPPLDPPFNWTGCYIGANVGGAWAEKKFVTAGGGLDEGGHTASGWAGGGQIGCDYQFSSNWVIGIQGMWDWSNLTGSHVVTFLQPPSPFSTRVRSFGTVTGRIGYTLMPSTLLYGKAGVGWAQDRFDFNCGVGCFDSARGTRSGFDLGAGLEWMFMPNWSLWVEYDHMFLGDKTLTFTGTGLFQERIRQDLDKVLVGVNYRFGGR